MLKLQINPPRGNFRPASPTQQLPHAPRLIPADPCPPDLRRPASRLIPSRATSAHLPLACFPRSSSPAQLSHTSCHRPAFLAPIYPPLQKKSSHLQFAHGALSWAVFRGGASKVPGGGTRRRAGKMGDIDKKERWMRLIKSNTNFLKFDI